MKYNNFEVKKRIVESGNSEVFNNWHEWTGVSMESFVEALEWLCSDPLNEDGKALRGIACEPDGTLVKLRMAYYTEGDRIGWWAGAYREDDGCVYHGKTKTIDDGSPFGKVIGGLMMIRSTDRV